MTFSLQTKVAAVFTNAAKVVTTFTNAAKSAVNYFLLKEDAFYLLLENGGKIILDEPSPVLTYSLQSKNIS